MRIICKIICCVLVVFFFFACPVHGQELSGYKIINNLTFKPHDGVFSVIQANGVEIRLSFLYTGLPASYTWVPEVDFHAEKETQILVNKNDNNNEIGRMTTVSLDSSMLAGYQLPQDYEQIKANIEQIFLKPYMEYLIERQPPSQADITWLYFGHTVINGMPVIYGVNQYTTTELEYKVYQPGTRMFHKSFIFIDKHGVFLIETLYPDESKNELEKIFDEIIGTVS